MAYDFSKVPNSLEEFWMPFTPQRLFNKDPRIVVSAEGMYYKDQSGKDILDGVAGQWCVNAGHNAPLISEAIKAQLDQIAFSTCMNYGHPSAFIAAKRLVDAFPDPFTHVFFSNSGSEAVDTALKIALNYHRARGQGHRRVLIGRERSYHGVNFGGISVAGLPYNRSTFGQLLPSVDHLPHTHDLEHNAFARGEPEWGAHLAENLERLAYLHDPENIAAVIVEPISGSTGVLPPPKGYLKKLREICDKYGILLIFDEVITGFGRMGTYTAAEHFGVMPDIITCAKGLTNAAVPMGATFVTKKIHDAFLEGPEYVAELMHGYTYSGHPLAAAAAIGTLDTFEQEGILDNAKKIMQPFEDAIHSLKDKPWVVDIRNCGILAGIQLEEFSKEDPGQHVREIVFECYRRGVMIRYTGPNLTISPPLIINEAQIDHMVSTISDVIDDRARRLGK